MKQDVLKSKMDELARDVYTVSKRFPRDEIYGMTSQLRRAALSIILNYIEGFARNGDKEFRNFLQISYGSLKEVQYLLFFSQREGFMSQKDYNKLVVLSDEVGALLWKRIGTVKNRIKNT